MIQAGDTGNEGAFTRYQYCTVGTAPGCTSNIQLIDVGGACKQDVAGLPQQGQTPQGRLSNVAQTVNWQVDPATYGGSPTFDITVTWQMNIAASQALFWNGGFCDKDTNQCGGPPALVIPSAAVVHFLLLRVASIRTALRSTCRFLLPRSARAGDRETLVVVRSPAVAAISVRAGSATPEAGLADHEQTTPTSRICRAASSEANGELLRANIKPDVRLHIPAR